MIDQPLHVNSRQHTFTLECRDGHATPDLVGRLMADIDPDLLAFLRTRVNSFFKWDLLHFLYSHPHFADTAESYARRLQQTTEVTRTELNDLSTQGVLDRSELGQVAIYSLTDNPPVRNLIQRFVEACNDRQFRSKAIYHIVRSMR